MGIVGTEWKNHAYQLVKLSEHAGGVFGDRAPFLAFQKKVDLYLSLYTLARLLNGYTSRGSSWTRGWFCRPHKLAYEEGGLAGEAKEIKQKLS